LSSLRAKNALNPAASKASDPGSGIPPGALTCMEKPLWSGVYTFRLFAPSPVMSNSNSASDPPGALVVINGKTADESRTKKENESGNDPGSGGLSVVVNENDIDVPR